MATTIKLKNGSGAPAASDLVQGEPAIDLTNKRLYTEDSGGSVIEVGTNPSSLSINGTAVTATAAEINTLDGITSSTAELNILDGVTSTAAELNILDGVTASTAEINILDGVTSTTAELNILDGVTSTAAELNILDGVTATTAELNILDGVTSTTAELNILDGVTATASELNILDGVTSTTAELNILDGVTSTAAELNILDGKTFLDEDDMSSNSATGIPSQQSVKAYVDANAGGGGGISNVVEDTTPQLGGDLDVNGNAIVSVSNGNIALTPNGSGLVRLDGNVDIQSGEIVLKNSGSVSNIKLYCESSNAHYTQLQSAAHSAYSGNVTLTLPASTDTLVGKATTDTLTNKTLTSPKINEDVAVTATATELNILDGVTATTAELNYVDGVTSAIQTQLDAKAPTASPTFTGTVTIPTADVNGGNIDGTTIGGTTAAAGTFTTFTSNGIDDNATSTVITIASGGDLNIGLPQSLLTGNGYERVINHPSDDSTRNQLAMLHTSNTAKASLFRFVKNRGGNSAWATTQSGDPLGGIQWYGTDSGASGPAFSASIDVDQTGTSGSSTVPTAMLFKVSDGSSTAERMRLDSSGGLRIGTTTNGFNTPASEKLTIKNTAIGCAAHFEATDLTGGFPIVYVRSTDSTAGSQVAVYFYRTTTAVGSITTTGSSTSYNTSSDYRLKENIVDAPAGNIDAIRVRSFDWKADGSHQTYGMVAQELVDVAPEAVTQGGTEDDMWAVDYSKLVPMMIKEIQDLKAEVAALKGAN